MIKIIQLILLLALSFNVTAQQHANDECSTAYEIFVQPNTTGNQRCDNAIYDWVAGYYNVASNATPSIPFYSMTGCNGYTNSTKIGSDDIWLKFKANASSRRIWLQGNDSMNFSFYHGANCGALIASGCFTYRYTYYDTIILIYTNPDTSFYNYIQISPATTGQPFYFQSCVQDYGTGFPASPFGTIQITTELIEHDFQLPINMYPNPCTNTINFKYPKFEEFDFHLFDMFGRKAKTFIISKQDPVDVSDILPGIYYYELRGANGKFKIGTLVKI